MHRGVFGDPSRPRRHLCEADLPAAGTPVTQLQEITLTDMPDPIPPILKQLFRQVCRLPKIIAGVFRDRRQQAVRNELEAERLDRIRNPEKYRGK